MNLVRSPRMYAATNCEIFFSSQLQPLNPHHPHPHSPPKAPL